MAKKKPRPHYKPAKSAQIEYAPEMTAPVKPASNFTAAAVVETGGLLLAPLIAFWIMRFVPINQNHSLDPYVYTGYINDFQDLLIRYGLTYYSVRFGLILPGQLFTHLFGPAGGYFTLRYVLALIAAIPLYYLVKRHFSQPVAVLTVAGLLTSPYFARALLWDHPDATGVPFLTAAVCLFLLDERPSLWRDTLAGAFAAMAVHSNFFVVSVIGIFGAVWLSFSLLFRLPLKDLVKHFAGVAAGALLVTALGFLYYWHVIGRPTDIFSVTLQVASGLVHGGTKQWRTPGTSWITMQMHVLTPIVLAICCIAVTRWRRTSFTGLIIVSFGVAVTAFYYVEQFLLDSDILQLFYYFSYLIPAVFLMLAFLWQTLWERTKRSSSAFIGVGLAALLAPWMAAIYGKLALPNLTVSHWLVLCGVLAVTLFLVVRESQLPAMRAIMPWLALILLSGFFTAGLADYSTLIRNRKTTDTTEMDVYRVALQFVRAVPKLAEHPGVIRFWYNNRIGNPINSVQSTYLWGYSKVNMNPPEDPGLPHLGEAQLQILRDPQVRYLGLLCESKEEVSQALAALTQEAIEFSAADLQLLTSGDYRVYFELLELTQSPKVVPR